MKKHHIAKAVAVLSSIVILASCAQVHTIPAENAGTVERTSTADSLIDSPTVNYNDVECYDIHTQVANGYRLANLVEEHRVRNPQEKMLDFYIWDSNAMSLDDTNDELLTNPKLTKIASSSSCASYKAIFPNDVSNDFLIYMGSSYTGGSLQKSREKESRDWEVIYDSSIKDYRDNLHTLAIDGRIHY